MRDCDKIEWVHNINMLTAAAVPGPCQPCFPARVPKPLCARRACRSRRCLLDLRQHCYPALLPASLILLHIPYRDTPLPRPSRLAESLLYCTAVLISIARRISTLHPRLPDLIRRSSAARPAAPFAPRQTCPASSYNQQSLQNNTQQNTSLAPVAAFASTAQCCQPGRVPIPLIHHLPPAPTPLRGSDPQELEPIANPPWPRQPALSLLALYSKPSQHG